MKNWKNRPEERFSVQSEMLKFNISSPHTRGGRGQQKSRRGGVAAAA